MKISYVKSAYHTQTSPADLRAMWGNASILLANGIGLFFPYR